MLKLYLNFGSAEFALFLKFYSRECYKTFLSFLVAFDIVCVGLRSFRVYVGVGGLEKLLVSARLFLLTELLVVEFCSQFGVCQVLLEDLIHLFVLFSREVVLPVTNLTCTCTRTHIIKPLIFTLVTLTYT